MNGETTEVIKNPTDPSLSVKDISDTQMRRIVDNPPEGTVDIEQGYWEETDGGTPILNTGGSPCLIIYALNTKSDRLISGHFPSVNHEHRKKFAQRDIKNAEQNYADNDGGIAIPDEKTTRYLTHNRNKETGYEEYLKMKQRIEEWGPENTEIYLFGHNLNPYGSTPEEYAKRVVKATVEQHDVMADFYNVGVPYYKQHDYRNPEGGKVDDTFYSADEKTIKHSERGHRRGGRFWLRK